MSDLETMDHEGITVAAGGEAVQIRPFTLGQFLKIIKLLRPIVGALKSAGLWPDEKHGDKAEKHGDKAEKHGDKAEKHGDKAAFKLPDDWPLRLVDVIAESGDDLVAFLAFATGKSREWLEALGADEGIALALGVFKVQAYFFGKKVLPQFTEMLSDGVTSLPSSSLPGTDDATLMTTPSENSSSTSAPQPATVNA